MNGMPARPAISRIAAASDRACASLSMTHGPATSASGAPPPTVTGPIVTGFTGTIIQDASAAVRGAATPDSQAAGDSSVCRATRCILCLWLASTKLANNGAGLSGFDLNSG